jgi:hypothetical protein
MLKVKELSKEMDYLQIRNGKLELLVNLRIVEPFSNLKRFVGDEQKLAEALEIIQNLPYRYSKTS